MVSARQQNGASAFLDGHRPCNVCPAVRLKAHRREYIDSLASLIRRFTARKESSSRQDTLDAAFAAGLFYHAVIMPLGRFRRFQEHLNRRREVQDIKRFRRLG